MSEGLIAILLLAAAGFLLGGVWALWRTAKFFASVLAVLVVIAAAAGVLWMVGA